MQDHAMTAQQASLAWQHAHPVTMVAISTGCALLVISLIITLRWLTSASAWKYHPGGAGGFFKDELVRWAAIIAPWLVLSITFRFYIYGLHPELNTPMVWVGFIACAIAFRFILRSLPPIKAMGRHIDAARAEAKAAKMARRGFAPAE